MEAKRAERAITRNEVLTTVGLVAALWVAYKLRGLLVLFFLGLIATLALRPALGWLERRGLPKRVAAAVLVLLGLGIIMTVIFSFLPQIINQVTLFFNNLPNYVNDLSRTTGIELRGSVQQAIENLSHSAGSVAQTALAAAAATFGIFFSMFTVGIITYYGLAEYDRWSGALERLAGKRRREVKSATNNVEHRLGGWIRGQALLSLVKGLLDLTAYLILGLPFAALLALFGGIMEVLPVLGPVVAAVPALLIALSVSVEKAIAVAIAYLIIQLLEAYVLAPRILGRAAGLHPLSVVVALIAGESLGGIVGAFLGVPILLFLVAIYEGVTHHRAPLVSQGKR